MYIFCIHMIMNVQNSNHKLYMEQGTHKDYHIFSVVLLQEV